MSTISSIQFGTSITSSGGTLQTKYTELWCTEKQHNIECWEVGLIVKTVLVSGHASVSPVRQ